MRILFVSNYYWPDTHGGYDLTCKDLVEWFVNRGHDVRVLTSKNRNAETEKYFFAENIIRQLSLFDYKNLNFLKEIQIEKHNIYIFQKTLKQFKPDIIFFSDVKRLGFTLLELAKSEAVTIWRYADPVPIKITSFSRSVKDKIKKFIKKVCAIPIPKYPLVNYLITVSKFTLDICKEKRVADKLCYIWDGINLDCEMRKLHETKIAETNLPKLLFVGRVVVTKGVHLILDVIIKLFEEKGMRCYLTIVGAKEDGYVNQIRERIIKYGLQEYVKIIDWLDRDKLESIYLEHDIFIHPHLWKEPSGNAILEAMKYGLPVITARLGGPCEIIEDGITGFLINPGDISDLVEKIYMLAIDPKLREQIAGNAYNFLEDNLDFEKQAEKYENFLFDIVKQK